jgi:hypothetical protein
MAQKPIFLHRRAKLIRYSESPSKTGQYTVKRSTPSLASLFSLFPLQNQSPNLQIKHFGRLFIDHKRYQEAKAIILKSIFCTFIRILELELMHMAVTPGYLEGEKHDSNFQNHPISHTNGSISPLI